MYGRASLTFDLIEPFRQQIVDKTVIALINRNKLQQKTWIIEIISLN